MKPKKSEKPVRPIYFDALPNDGFLRVWQLKDCGIIPFSNATLWRRVENGSFPRPIKLSPAVTAWRVSDLRAWLKAQAVTGN